MKRSKMSFGNIVHTIGKIISWALFILLLLVAAFLLYYYIATKIYVAKGEDYKPKFSIYTVISESMTGTINKFDSIIDVRVDSPDDIGVDDIITFISTDILTPGITNTHRVIGITKSDDGEVCYQTKGDFNQVPDGACAKYRNVLGKVIIKIPYLGRVQYFLSSPSGLILFIFIPALFIIGKDIFKMTRLSNISKSAERIQERKKPSTKKVREERMRKENIKRKLLDEDKGKKEYYKDPVVKTIEKSNKKNEKKRKN